MHRRGFSLIELLVVMAIISVLVGLLLFGLNAAKSAARRTQCMTNLRQIGLALHGFTDANNGEFPHISGHGHAKEEAWMYQLLPFMEDFHGGRICPDDPAAEVRRENKETSYVLNSFLAVELGGFKPITNRYRLKEPSKTILLFEATENVHIDHIHGDNYFNPINVALQSPSDPRVFNAIKHEVAVDRHFGGVAHYLYADTHVSAVSAERIFNLSLQGTAEYNFVRPPGH